MEDDVREGKLGLDTQNYFGAVKDKEGKEYRTVVQAVDLAQALLALKQKFQRETSLLEPNQKWIEDNDGPDFHVKVAQLKNSCILGCFRVPAEVQFWDTPKILQFYVGKNVSGHFTK